MITTEASLAYLATSGLEMSPPGDNVTGLVVVDRHGLRVGEVEDVVIDTADRRARLICVVSGGILGGAPARTLLPVETVTKVNDRVHVDRSYAEIQDHRVVGVPSGTTQEWELDPEALTVEQAYAAYGIVPFWRRQVAVD